MPRLFCFGLGFSAMTLTTDLLAKGWQVAGTCRTPEKQARLAADGIDAWLFDGDQPLADSAAALSGTTHLLASAPPSGSGPSGDPVLDRHGQDLASLSPPLDWVGYLSTTGVYGDRAGGVVDEQSPLTPTGERGRRRVQAEAAWLGLWREHGLPVHLFRLSGIYGPGRSALDQARTGTARRVEKPGQVFNRIHVADITATLEASMDRPNPGAAYNLADDEPSPSHEVIAYACRLIGADIPPLIPFESADMSPMARSFYADNKIVDNRRIKQELGVHLAFPTYRAGLDAQFATESGRTGGGHGP